MFARSADTILLTADLEVAHVTSAAIPWEQIDWQQSFSSVLTAISPESRVLVVDAQADATMAYLLATLFLDQRPGRAAVVIEAEGQESAIVDRRVVPVARPLTPGALSRALDAATAAATPFDCEPAERELAVA